MEKANKKKVNLRNMIPMLGLVFVFLLFLALTRGSLVRFSNVEVITNQAFGIMLVGAGAVFIYAHGGIDLSLGSLQGICILFIVLLVRAGWNPVLVMIVSILTGIVSGALVGGSSVVFGIPVFITSLCMNFIMRGTLTVATAKGMMYLPEHFVALDRWGLKIAVLLVILVVSFLMFNYTRFGKYEKAIGGSSVVAKLSGVNVSRYRILAHVLTGAYVGVSAFFSAARAGSVFPASGQGFEMDVLIALVLGGLSLAGGASTKIRCAVLGALTIAIMENGFVLIGTNPNAIQGIKGLIFIVTVIFSFERKKGQVVN